MGQQIALAFPRGAHQETFIEGVLKYDADNHLDWSYTLAPESLNLSVEQLVNWPGDGVLAALDTPEQAEYALKMRAKVVNISSALPESPVPRSKVDNIAVGRSAAEYLLTRGLTNFAFYGLTDVEYSKRRWMGFLERLQGTEHTVEQHLATATFSFQGDLWVKQHQEVADWLTALPKPCGVFTVSDHRGRHILDAARQLGLKSPGEIAVLGVDNEQIICEHISPTLSSVIRNDVLEGYRAAELLHQRLAGQTPEDVDRMVQPGGVVERESTAAFAVSDPRLRAALEYLVENKADPITVEELADHIDVSRRWLEYAFREELGESPYQYLQRERLKNAKRQLMDRTSDTISRIAKLSGFASEKQFRVTFQRAFGMTPGEYRKINN